MVLLKMSVKEMTKYLNNSIPVDFITTIVICSLLYYLKANIPIKLNLDIENVLGIGKTLIGISSTLIGFLLTVITLIVTLKKSHQASNSPQNYSLNMITLPI